MSRASGAGVGREVEMLEKFADYFYDPVVFWTAPLVLVALVAGWRRMRVNRRRRFSGKPAGDGSEGP